MHFIRLSARLFGRFDLGAGTPLEAVAAAKVPILLYHGEDDSFVPVEMSRAIHDACASPCTLLTFPGADHGTSYLVDPARYRRALQTFMDQCLKQ